MVPDPADDPFRLLVVCTANICRSVMAEQFLRREADERDLPVEISSCGLLFDGEPASDKVAAVMAERDLDVAGHASRRATPELLAGHDLIVTMERAQARELAMMAGDAAVGIHTLGSVVEWFAAPDRDGLPAAPRARLAAFAEGRRARDLLGVGPEEVADPHGRSKRVHRRTADRLEGLCIGLLDGLFGPAETGAAETGAGTED